MSEARERRRLPSEKVDKLSEPELERYLTRLEEADEPAGPALQEATPEEVDALIRRHSIANGDHKDTRASDGSDEPLEPLTVEFDENASDEETDQAVKKALRERAGLEPGDDDPVEEFVDAFFAILDAEGVSEEGADEEDDDEETEEFLRSRGIVRDPKDPHHLVCSVRPREVVVCDADCLEPGAPLIDLGGSVEEVCAAVDLQFEKKKHGGN